MQWQWQQELALRLSKKNRVVFVENTGVRSIKISDSKRVFNRIRNFFSSVLGFRSINKNLVIFSPLFFHSLIIAFSLKLIHYLFQAL